MIWALLFRACALTVDGSETCAVVAVPHPFRNETALRSQPPGIGGDQQGEAKCLTEIATS
ncbi:MAG: hypothetical protein V2I43_10495 [Parvularcula sp.]|jgi:hypothetical protein|nr:hypothetical protein [Parvularcula sp.]